MLDVREGMWRLLVVSRLCARAGVGRRAHENPAQAGEGQRRKERDGIPGGGNIQNSRLPAACAGLHEQLGRQ